ncbi:uncharacterized protein LOC111086062 [Limulus polyphemus]|uniref:Uncharacterized protein LOC111086062 n=1 Tax=Limulus polyphemus TaxID=6850 RepID=A0ABM1SHR9_LIMPO|nr:uncharacterized protein LOC111086062 [Limulus polyphemus]XP_022243173.1 uncharacterized protein LOC111086062 [Limulus polyphemus]XP_022243174.1 uncharacterized protein LOC111086062 [Limulus polyphemus]
MLETRVPFKEFNKEEIVRRNSLKVVRVTASFLQLRRREESMYAESYYKWYSNLLAEIASEKEFRNHQHQLHIFEEIQCRFQKLLKLSLNTKKAYRQEQIWDAHMMAQEAINAGIRESPDVQELPHPNNKTTGKTKKKKKK